ncbi:MAG: hypothetical protein AAFZ65_20925, partial [Planctomycetota bacterium]
DARLLPLTNRALDLPLVLGGAWFDLPEGLRQLDREPVQGPLVGLGPLPGSIEAVPGSDGRRYATRAWLVPEAPGRLALPDATARYATAERFELDWLGEQRPVGRTERFARAELPALEVRPWPTRGRPDGFIGAVGKFALEVDLAPRDLSLGDELELVYRLEGRGGLDGLALPERLELDGFQELGRTVRPASGQADRASLEVAYRLRADRAGAIDFQPPSWSWLAPSAVRFVEAELASLPIVVRGSTVRASTVRDVAPPEPEPRSDAREAKDDHVARELRLWFVSDGLPFTIPAIGVLSSLLVIGVLVLRDLLRRALRGATGVPVPTEVVALADRCVAAAHDDHADRTEAALRDLMLALVGGNPRTLVGADVQRGLTQLGVDAATANDAARLFSSFEAARFGGAPVALDSEHLEATLRAVLAVPRTDWRAVEARLERS